MRITPQPLRDPTDVVIQGGVLAAQLHSVPASFVRPFFSEASPAAPTVQGTAPGSYWADPPVVGDAHAPIPGVPRANGGVVGAGGTWVPLDCAPILPRFTGSTARWRIVGQTLDSVGAPLPSCLVYIFDVGQLFVGASPLVAMAVSSAVDGSFAIEVPGNRAFQAIAYLDGSPDVAGITLYPLDPTMV